MNVFDDTMPLPGDSPEEPGASRGGGNTGGDDDQPGLDGIFIEVWSVTAPKLDADGLLISGPPSDACFGLLHLSNYDLPTHLRMRTALAIINRARKHTEELVDSLRIDDWLPSFPSFVLPVLTQFAMIERGPQGTDLPIVLISTPDRMHYTRPTRASAWLRLTTVEGDMYGVWYVSQIDPATGAIVASQALGAPSAAEAQEAIKDGMPYYPLAPANPDLLPIDVVLDLSAQFVREQMESEWEANPTLKDLRDRHRAGEFAPAEPLSGWDCERFWDEDEANSGEGEADA